MSQAELADRMTKLGTPWKRATVVTVEKRGTASRGTGVGRDAVTIQEWMHLAQALDAPPPLLLADPRHDESVPIAEGHLVSTWQVLLWLTGSGTIDGGIASYPQGTEGTELIWCGRLVAEVAGMVERTPLDFSGQRAADFGWAVREGGSASDAAMRVSLDGLHRAALTTMRTALERIRELGAAPPQLGPRVISRAVELGVELLPGQEG